MKYEKGTFIVVPNTPSVMVVGGMEQALYMWLCYHANQFGNSFPSRSTLAGYLKCDVRSVDKYLKTLEEYGLVKKEHRFNNNEQSSNTYHLPLYQGGVKNSPPSENISPPPAKIFRTELNPVLTKQTSTIRIVPDNNEIKTKTKPKYPNARIAFSWFPRRQKSWDINTTELQHGELLYERGEEKVRGILRFVDEHQDEEFFSKVVKPSDLERKWLDIVHYAKKNRI